MSNVRLLRQSLEDYNSRIATLDTQYQSDYDAYAARVRAFNADVMAHPYDASPGLSSGRFGRPGYIMGRQPDQTVQATDPDTGQPAVDINGNPLMTTQVGRNIYADKPSEVVVGEAPAQTVAPRSPNLTNNDYKALANPGTDPAGVVRDNNKGYTGNSTIAALNDTPMRNSAFSDPEDPQGLKERGILARTLGGQL